MSLAYKLELSKRNTIHLKTRFVSNGREHRFESNFFQAHSQVSDLTADQVRNALRPEGCADPSWPLVFEGECTEEEGIFFDQPCTSETPVDRLSAFSHEAEMIIQRSKELQALNSTPKEYHQKYDGDATEWTLMSMGVLHDYGAFMLERFADLERDSRGTYFRHADEYFGHIHGIREMDKVIHSRRVELTTTPNTEPQSTSTPIDMAEEEHADHPELDSSAQNLTAGGSMFFVDTADGSTNPSGKNRKGRSKRSKGKEKGKGKGKGKDKSEAHSTAEDTQVYLTDEALAKIKVLRATAEKIKTNSKSLVVTCVSDAYAFPTPIMMSFLIAISLSISTMHNALAQAVRQCMNSPEKSVRQVAREYNVAPGTLNDQITGRHLSSGKAWNRKLSLVQEDVLIAKINDYASRGTLLTPRHVCGLAEGLARKKLEKDWVGRFVQRHPDRLSSQFHTYHELSRRQADTTETRRAWYSLMSSLGPS